MRLPQPLPEKAKRVCYWLQTDMQTAQMNAPFEGNNGHDVTRCALLTQSRLCWMPSAALPRA